MYLSQFGNSFSCSLFRHSSTCSTLLPEISVMWMRVRLSRHTSTTIFFEDSLVFAINTHCISVLTQTGLKTHFSLFPTTLKCKVYYLLGSEVLGSCLIVLYYYSIVIKSSITISCTLKCPLYWYVSSLAALHLSYFPAFWSVCFSD